MSGTAARLRAKQGFFRNMGASQQTTGTLRPRRGRRIVSLATATALAFANVPAQAQRSAPIVRDAEIEQVLREYTQPILRVAGLSQQNVQVVIINDRSFNAFVADARRIFVNAGALIEWRPRTRSLACLRMKRGTSPVDIWRACASSSPRRLRNRSSQWSSAWEPWLQRAQRGNPTSAKLAWPAIGSPRGHSEIAFGLSRAQEDSADGAGSQVPDRNRTIGKRNVRNV